MPSPGLATIKKTYQRCCGHPAKGFTVIESEGVRIRSNLRHPDAKPHFNIGFFQRFGGPQKTRILLGVAKQDFFGKGRALVRGEVLIADQQDTAFEPFVAQCFGRPAASLAGRVPNSRAISQLKSSR